MAAQRKTFVNSTQLGSILFNIKKLDDLPIFEIYTYLVPKKIVVEPEHDAFVGMIKYCFNFILIMGFIDTSFTSLPLDIPLFFRNKPYAMLLCMNRRFMVRTITDDKDEKKLDVVGYGLPKFGMHGYSLLAHLYKLIPRMPSIVFNSLFTPVYQIDSPLFDTWGFGYKLLIFGKNTANIIYSIKNSNTCVSPIYLIRQFSGQMLFAMSLIVCEVFHTKEMTFEGAVELESKIESFCYFMEAFLTVFVNLQSTSRSINEFKGDKPKSLACEHGHRMSTFIHTYVKVSMEIFFSVYELLSVTPGYNQDLKPIYTFFMQVGQDMSAFTTPNTSIEQPSFKWSVLFQTLLRWYRPDIAQRCVKTRSANYTARELLCSYLKEINRLKRVDFVFSMHVLDYKYHY